MSRAILIAGLVLISTADYASALYCSEPDAPYCASRYGSFDDEWDFNRCKREMESYRSEVESYVDCLKDEINETISEYEDAVSDFNRRARGS